MEGFKYKRLSGLINGKENRLETSYISADKKRFWIYQF